MDVEVFGDKTQIETKPREKPEMRNLMCTEFSFGSEHFVLSASEAELSL